MENKKKVLVVDKNLLELFEVQNTYSMDTFFFLTD